MYRDPVTVGNNEYNERLYTDRAIDFIEDFANDPFFIYYSMFTPHGGLEEPPLYRDGINGNDLIDYSLCNDTALTTNQQLLCRVMYYAQLMIEEIIEALKDNHIYNNTYLIITSDNGPMARSPNAERINSGQTLPLRGISVYIQCIDVTFNHCLFA